MCDCEREDGPRVGMDRSDASTKSSFETNNFLFQNNSQKKQAKDIIGTAQYDR